MAPWLARRCRRQIGKPTERLPPLRHVQQVGDRRGAERLLHHLPEVVQLAVQRTEVGSVMRRFSGHSRNRRMGSTALTTSRIVNWLDSFRSVKPPLGPRCE